MAPSPVHVCSPYAPSKVSIKICCRHTHFPPSMSAMRMMLTTNSRRRVAVYFLQTSYPPTHTPRFGVPSSIAVGLSKIDELIINAVWTDVVTPRHTIMLDFFQIQFAKPIYGIILEMPASPEAWTRHPTHLKESLTHLPMSATSNI